MAERWYDRPMRICAFQWNLGDRTFEAPRIAHEAGFSMEQLCHVMEGDSLAELYEPERHRARLDRYLEVNRPFGTRIVVYFNAHCVFPDVIEKHPEWGQRLADGKPAPAYGTYLLTCVNTPWRDVVFESCRALLRNHPVDGIFLDGPMFLPPTCHCPHCDAEFRSAYGKPFAEGTAKERQAFKTESINRFVKDVRAAMHSVNPDAIVYANNTGLAENVTGCTIDGLYPHVDFIGTEGGFMFYDDPNRTSIWKGILSANYLESKAGGKPYVIFAAGNHTSWARSMHSPEESELLFASAVACGAQVWYGIHGPAPMLRSRGGRAAVAFNEFLAANEAQYQGTHRRAEAAILWSGETLANFPEDVDESDFTRQATVDAAYGHGRFTQEFKGVFDALFRAHLQLAIHDDASLLAADLSGVKLLVLPNAACLSDALAAKVARYVADGGTLLATGATSFYDTDGKRRPAPALAEVLGVRSVDEALTYGDGCGYLSVVDDALREAGDLAELTGGLSHVFRCTFAPDARPLAAQFVPMAGSYDAFPTERFVAAVERRHGKGRVVYVAGDLGATLANHGLVELKRLLAHLGTTAYVPEIEAEGAFESCAVLLREQPAARRRLVHFVNYTGQMKRPVDRTIPCRDVAVTLRGLPPVASVSLLRAGGTLPFAQDPGSGDVRFTVPSIERYEVASVQLA